MSAAAASTDYLRVIKRKAEQSSGLAFDKKSKSGESKQTAAAIKTNTAAAAATLSQDNRRYTYPEGKVWSGINSGVHVIKERVRDKEGKITPEVYRALKIVDKSKKENYYDEVVMLRTVAPHVRHAVQLLDFFSR
jgi:hypothetical protein